jgi:hypothetical protein
MVLLLHRFIERFRERLPGAESGIADLNQPLRFVAARGNGALRFVIEDAKGNALSESRIPEVASLGIRAPSEPGFFSVSRNGERLYSGGANFVDPRLSDFRDASSRDDLDGFVPERTMVHRREDRAVSFWLGLLALSILCSWHFSDTSRRRTTP